MVIRRLRVIHFVTEPENQNNELKKAGKINTDRSVREPFHITHSQLFLANGSIMSQLEILHLEPVEINSVEDHF